MARQPDPQQAADQRTLQGLAAALAAGAAASVPAVVGILGPAGVGAAAARAALELLTRVNPAPAAVSGVAVTATTSSESAYRAAYLLNAARRIQRDLDAGKPLREALRRELPNYQAHRSAVVNRRQAASAVDMAARTHGPLLGWKAVMDDRTSAECRRADGKNFSVTSRPLIGWPGSVHPHCRCRPVAPHVGAGLVDAVTTPTERKEAVA